MRDDMVLQIWHQDLMQNLIPEGKIWVDHRVKTILLTLAEWNVS